MIGVSVLGPVIVRPAMRMLGFAYEPVFGTVGQMARENARRNPRRTAATSSALMIGVALVTFITVLAASAKSSTAARVDRVLTADYVVDSGAWEQGLSPVLAHDLAGVPGVKLLAQDGRAGVLLQVEGEMDGLIKALAAFPVSDFETERPSLEEVFLAYYEGDRKGEV